MLRKAYVFMSWVWFASGAFLACHGSYERATLCVAMGVTNHQLAATEDLKVLKRIVKKSLYEKRRA